MKNNTLFIGLTIIGISLFLFFGSPMFILTKVTDNQVWKELTFYATGGTILGTNYDEIGNVGGDRPTTAEIRLTTLTGGDVIKYDKLDLFTGSGASSSPAWALQKMRSNININRINKFVMTGYTGNNGGMDQSVEPECNTEAIVCIKELVSDFSSAIIPEGFTSIGDINIGLEPNFFVVSGEKELLCLARFSITQNKNYGTVYVDTATTKFGGGSINNLVFEKTQTEWILSADNGYRAAVPVSQINLAAQHILEFYHKTGSERYKCPPASIRSLYDNIVVNNEELGLPVEPVTPTTTLTPTIPFIDYPIFEKLPESLRSANQTINTYTNSYFGLIGLVGLLLSSFALLRRR